MTRDMRLIAEWYDVSPGVLDRVSEHKDGTGTWERVRYGPGDVSGAYRTAPYQVRPITQRDLALVRRTTARYPVKFLT